VLDIALCEVYNPVKVKSYRPKMIEWLSTIVPALEAAVFLFVYLTFGSSAAHRP
jgi:hypothetical protein